MDALKIEKTIDEAERRSLSWLKAQDSTPFGQCVEIAAASGGIAIRDSKNPDGPVLLYTRDEFATFLHGAQNGEFDHLVR